MEPDLTLLLRLSVERVKAKKGKPCP